MYPFCKFIIANIFNAEQKHSTGNPPRRPRFIISTLSFRETALSMDILPLHDDVLRYLNYDHNTPDSIHILLIHVKLYSEMKRTHRSKHPFYPYSEYCILILSYVFKKINIFCYYRHTKIYLNHIHSNRNKSFIRYFDNHILPFTLVVISYT